MCCGVFSWWGQLLRDGREFDKCVLCGRCNEFVPAGLACVVFSCDAQRFFVPFVSVSLRNDGKTACFVTMPGAVGILL